MAAVAFAIIGRSSSTATSAWIQLKTTRTRTPVTKKNRRLFSVVSSSSSSSSSYAMTTDDYDPCYKTLKIRPDASESEIKTAFRRLALQYHPDVCRGTNCTVQFHQINHAYDIAMSNIRGETKRVEECETYDDVDETFRGMNDPDWDMWEEWMGWEGAGIRDYSSHINPYI